MPKKRSKGRGRGRGSSTASSADSDAPKRPGASNVDDTRGEVKTVVQQTPSEEQTQTAQKNEPVLHEQTPSKKTPSGTPSQAAGGHPRQTEQPIASQVQSGPLAQGGTQEQADRSTPAQARPVPQKDFGHNRSNQVHDQSLPQGTALPQAQAGHANGSSQAQARPEPQKGNIGQHREPTSGNRSNQVHDESLPQGTTLPQAQTGHVDRSTPAQARPEPQKGNIGQHREPTTGNRSNQVHDQSLPQGTALPQAQAGHADRSTQAQARPEPQKGNIGQHREPNRSNQVHDQSLPQGTALPQAQAGASNIPPPRGNGHTQRSGRQNVQVIASGMSEERPSHLKQQQEPRPPRPGYGDQGRLIKLKANFFKLDFRSVDYIYHYDIDIKPERTPIPECREIVNSAVEKYLKVYFDNHRPAFDGRKNLYSRKKLSAINGTGCELEVVLPGKDGGKDRQFKLTVKFAAEVRVTDLNQFLAGQRKMVPEAVQALDIVLRQIPSLHFTPVGRSFFPTNRRGFDLGGGCEVRSGFYQSIRPSQWKTMLVNIDVSSKAFMKAQPVIDCLCEILPSGESERISDRRWQMKPWMAREFLDAIKGFKVETNHIPGMKRKYLVMELGKNASTYKFQLQDENDTQARTISVEQYFKEKYKLELRYPHLPCLVVGQKKNHLPMEVCQMVSSQKRKLTDTQTAEMIKKVTRPPRDRQRDIIDWADQLEKNSRQYLHNEYGMSINKSMVDVDGRVLPPPKVNLGDNASIVPRDGVWDMRDKKFFRGTDVRMWAIVSFVDQRRCNEEVTRGFARQMENVCRKEGMRMNGNPCNVQYATNNDNVQHLLSNLVLRYRELQLIVVVLPPQGNKEVYKEVKRVGDTVLGIPTQCVQTKQFVPAKAQVCSNIAMKINVKLGGTNHIVDPSSMPPLFRDVIVFGADVTHPSPGEGNIPSIAAVTASMDCHASRYAARVRAQTHIKDKSAQEIILDMADMVKELLVAFYKQTKSKPKRIIFYRDGVSEGQFDQVLLHEVRAVQQACLDIQKDGQYQPPITFLVVQKRHHARFFCTDRKDESGRAGNVPPGTMVDRGITHPFEFDFYLCSHQGIQGTSRPTHYHVLYDDNNFSANDLHKLTYHLCHTYARCTRSVSMPSPAYYAHLVAFRARHHINGLASRNSQGKPEKDLLKEFCDAINVKDEMKGGMYFA